MKITQENVKLNNRLTNVALYKYVNSIEEHHRVERRLNTITKGISRIFLKIVRKNKFKMKKFNLYKIHPSPILKIHISKHTPPPVNTT